MSILPPGEETRPLVADPPPSQQQPQAASRSEEDPHRPPSPHRYYYDTFSPSSSSNNNKGEGWRPKRQPHQPKEKQQQAETRVSRPNRSRRFLKKQYSSISEPETRSGIFGASSNIVNTIVGSGIFGIPFAIRKAGIVAGVVLLVAVAHLTVKSMRMLVGLATFHPKLVNLGVLTYEDLMYIPYRKWGKYFIYAAMVLNPYGGCVSYLLVLKDTVPTVLRLDGDDAQRNLVLVVASAIISLPLCMQRDMASLAFASTLNVAADVILVALIAATSPILTSVRDAGGIGRVVAENWIHPHLFIGLGSISFAMCCQHASFLVSHSLENVTVRRWGHVAKLSLTSACLLSLVLGVTGYLGFLNDTQGDILNNFASDSITANIGRALLAVHMFMVYPMETYVIRHVIIQVLYDGDMDGIPTVDSETGEPIRYPWYRVRRYHWLSVLIYVTTLLPCLHPGNNLGIVSSLTGALAASTVCYVAPGLAYFGINGDYFVAWSKGLLHSRCRQTREGLSDQKPLWWYLAGFPLWTGLARLGDAQTTEFLKEVGAESQSQIVQTPDSERTRLATAVQTEDENVFLPSPEGFCLSAFFILFGAIALVVGWSTVIYDQVVSS